MYLTTVTEEISEKIFVNNNFQVLVTKINHKEENGQNISFNR